MNDQLQDFARLLERAQRDARHKKHSKPYIAMSTPASALGYKCERRLVYLRTDPTAAEAPNEELSSIFEEGRIHETQARRELSELGYEVLEGEVAFYDARLELSGHIDGKVRAPWGRRIPAEIKSWTGEGPHSEEEWRESPSDLMRRYYAQMQSYLFLTAEPEGLLIVKDKVTGLWAVAPARLDYEYAEQLLQKAERVRDAVKAGELPARIADRSECRACPWFTKCLPADADIDPILLSDDAELLRDLEHRDALARDAKTHKQIDERIKERFKLTKGDRFVIGSDWLVTKKVATNGAVTVKTERLSPGPSDGGSSVTSPLAG
jgi:CRISPR/Cas system-associated exonuclease Cas4 (RecB family)